MNVSEKAVDDCWQDADGLKWAARNWAAKIGVKVPQIHLRRMSRKWASISTSGRLTLNSELLEVSKLLGEFVIVHEVIHIIAPNHGKVFKSFMFAYLPDWPERERRLRDHEREKMLSKASREDSIT
jgi:predicted metal-dependent hydrolase